MRDTPRQLHPRTGNRTSVTGAGRAPASLPVYRRDSREGRAGRDVDWKLRPPFLNRCTHLYGLKHVSERRFVHLMHEPPLEHARTALILRSARLLDRFKSRPEPTCR